MAHLLILTKASSHDTQPSPHRLTRLPAPPCPTLLSTLWPQPTASPQAISRRKAFTNALLRLLPNPCALSSCFAINLDLLNVLLIVLLNVLLVVLLDVLLDVLLNVLLIVSHPSCSVARRLDADAFTLDFSALHPASRWQPRAECALRRARKT